MSALGELTALSIPPKTFSWFQGDRFAAGGEWRGREGLGGGGGKRGRGMGRGKLGDSALVVGGQTPLLKGLGLRLGL